MTLRTKSFQIELDDTSEKFMEMAIQFDYELFKGKGIDKPTFSDWIRFLINTRLSQIKEELP